ncbi:hypothetical protein J2Z31_000319 [Sinorhizobium kostiense]|uniref:Uncharacterized protein n=1 Tax=Sinorhizobium kostiense TaxID=76747 RepID=A0ABS4QT47_9HYPH|nr:hypothetical protein [Sinorhizobium kostiense]MBP2233829.1 hypothetical protein [Sinorhizobium kostiense]
MSVDAQEKVNAAYAIEYLQEHPEAGLCCEGRRWWITPNANETDRRALCLDEIEAERLTEDPRLRHVSAIAHSGRSLWIVRRMT